MVAQVIMYFDDFRQDKGYKFFCEFIVGSRIW